MIEIKELSLKVPTLRLDRISLQIKDGEYFILLGPTGAGKSLFLDVIAGAYKPDDGRIIMDGMDITNRPPEHRRIGYVPQDLALFNNMNVIKNITFGLIAKGVNNTEAEEIANPLIKSLELKNLIYKRPEVLSGGEKQKVAIARALAVKPKILLLDEPLTGMDQNLKEKFIYELKRIHSEFEVSIIHVTHERAQAMILADRVGVLNQGRLVQTGKYEDLLNKPNSEFVAKFMGIENVVRIPELNRVLNIDENTTIAFTPSDVIITENGFELPIDQIIRTNNGFKITGKLFGNSITIKADKNLSINEDTISIKIKKYIKIS